MCKNNRRGSKDNVRGRWVTVKKGENNTKYSGGFSKVGKAIIGGLFIYTLASYGYRVKALCYIYQNKEVPDKLKRQIEEFDIQHKKKCQLQKTDKE